MPQRATRDSPLAKEQDLDQKSANIRDNLRVDQSETITELLQFSPLSIAKTKSAKIVPFPYPG
jgi:hypothetical protein